MTHGFRLLARLILCNLFLLGFLQDASTENNSAKIIRDVSISQPFFNPTLGQTIEISFVIAKRGDLTVSILDRDGFLVKTVVAKRNVEGKVMLNWDGTNNALEVVPDEAYSLKIDLVSAEQ